MICFSILSAITSSLALIGKQRRRILESVFRGLDLSWHKHNRIEDAISIKPDYRLAPIDNRTQAFLLQRKRIVNIRVISNDKQARLNIRLCRKDAERVMSWRTDGPANRNLCHQL